MTRQGFQYKNHTKGKCFTAVFLPGGGGTVSIVAALKHDSNLFNLWVVHVELEMAEVTLRHHCFPMPVTIPPVLHMHQSLGAGTIGPSQAAEHSTSSVKEDLQNLNTILLMSFKSLNHPFIGSPIMSWIITLILILKFNVTQSYMEAVKTSALVLHCLGLFFQSLCMEHYHIYLGFLENLEECITPNLFLQYFVYTVHNMPSVSQLLGVYLSDMPCSECAVIFHNNLVKTPTVPV
jgi:hypothetical protein